MGAADLIVADLDLGPFQKEVQVLNEPMARFNVSLRNQLKKKQDVSIEEGECPNCKN